VIAVVLVRGEGLEDEEKKKKKPVNSPNVFFGGFYVSCWRQTDSATTTTQPVPIY
jgi:hypothetical protein